MNKNTKNNQNGRKSIAMTFNDATPRVAITDRDVLLGRGRGQAKHTGNKRFLGVVGLRRDEYNDTNSYKNKGRISGEIFNEMTVARNARFLQLIPTGQPIRNVIKEGEWVVASKKASMDKIKQALRQKRDGSGEGSAPEPVEVPSISSSEETYMPPYTLAQRGEEVETKSAVTASETTAVAMLEWGCDEDNLFDGVNVGSIGSELQKDEACASFFPIDDTGDGDMKPHASTRVVKRRRSSGSIASVLSRSSSVSSLGGTFSLLSPQIFENNTASCIAPRLLLFENDPLVFQQSIAGFDSSAFDEDELLTAALPDENGSESLLSMMGMSTDQPRITDEQFEIERATMTGAERSAVLTDVFGKYCNVDSPPDKRARTDFDHDSIDLLLNEMKLEISQIPKNEREAITEAVSKCEAFEFSDKRLERFLRCEDIDAKRSARRFVTYWENRRQLFGSDKYLLPMTLSGALRDDLDAIEDGVFVILPHLDMSGRIIQFMDPYRRREGRYSSGSLVRAFWYALEVTSQQETDPRSSHVAIAWHKRTSLWNYDRVASDQMTTFEKTCTPSRLACVHVCCPSSIVMKVLKPIILAIKTKYNRFRMNFHDVPDTEIANVLSEYGIQKHMLPTEMGGAIPLNLYQAEWIETRRAIEMTEI